MRTVLLVTTWGIDCGIAEHSAMLKQAAEAADHNLVVLPWTNLDPNVLPDSVFDGTVGIVHLNYQGALHSRWTPEAIYAVKRRGVRVVVTYHDTGVPNSDQCKAICAAADAAIVHEPFDDLSGNVVYWRMGVPGWHEPYQQDRSRGSWCEGRPILGTVGFPFPWKCYDELAKQTARVGWALLLLAPRATSEDCARWMDLNPHTYVEGKFLPRSMVISQLMGCDATAFTYVCHNTGQSGAILQGIAARKPVHALATCRQFRALFGDKLGRTAITWAETFEDLAFNLSHFTRMERVSPAIVALAEQESWEMLGAKYAELYRGLLS